MTFDLIFSMEPWKRYVIFATFWFWICLFLVGQNLESKTVLRIPKPYQLIGNNTSEKIVDVENDLDNLISQKYEEIKKSKSVLQTPKPNQLIRIVNSNSSEKIVTGKSFSEALIFASTNPQYDKRLFIELHVQYMKIARSEHGENMLCT